MSGLSLAQGRRSRGLQTRWFVRESTGGWPSWRSRGHNTASDGLRARNLNAQWRWETIAVSLPARLANSGPAWSLTTGVLTPENLGTLQALAPRNRRASPESADYDGAGGNGESEVPSGATLTPEPWNPLTTTVPELYQRTQVSAPAGIPKDKKHYRH